MGQKTRGRYFLLGEEGLVPFGAGIFSRKEERNREKVRFYPLGQEQKPETVLRSTVKAFSFQGHRLPDDEGQKLLFERDGKRVTLVEQREADFTENKAIFYDCVLEISGAEGGSAKGPWGFEARLFVQSEERKSLS